MDFGAWGFTGLFQRALEIPSGVIPGIFTAAVSPTQRARIRYNDVLKQLEASIDGGAYAPFAGTGSGNSFQSSFEAVEVVILAASTTITTLPALTANGRPVFIEASIEVTGSNIVIVNWQLFRDGVEMDAAQRFDDTTMGGGESFTTTPHWIDTTPGASPVYSLRAIASATPGAAVNQRRLTAITLIT